MIIDMFVPFDPAKSNDILFATAAESTRRGAERKDMNEDSIIISQWKQQDGPMWTVCAVEGKRPILIIASEPAHKDVVLAGCKSLKVD